MSGPDWNGASPPPPWGDPQPWWTRRDWRRARRMAERIWRAASASPPPKWGDGAPPPWGDWVGGNPQPGWSRRDWRSARRAARGAWRAANAPASAFKGFDPGRIYRDTERGWIAGVCAGIADYAGVDPMPVRLAAVLFLIFFFLPAVVAYIAFAIVLKPKPPEPFASAEQEALWRHLRTEPASVLNRAASRLRGLDRRVRRMETLVTSEEFDLRRGFRDLGG